MKFYPAEGLCSHQCLHQKSEAEKKLSTLTFQESSSNDTTILVKHLQEELRNYVSYTATICFWNFMLFDLFVGTKDDSSYNSSSHARNGCCVFVV